MAKQFGALMLVASSLPFAATPVLTVSKPMTINAPKAKVWDAAKNFSGLNTGHRRWRRISFVEASTIWPSQCALSLKGSCTINEKLPSFDYRAHSFKYAILEDVLPDSRNSSPLVLKSAGDGNRIVTWSGHFQRKNVGVEPGDLEKDQTATDALADVYPSGLGT